MARKERHMDVPPHWLDRGPVRCPLCGRPIPPEQQDKHHLVPRVKGGQHTEVLHRVCHRQIHALFSESELAQRYATVDALLAHPEIQAFVRWVQKRPDDYLGPVKLSRRLRD